MKLYAMHDKKANSLSAFCVAKSDAQVTRDFAQAVLQPNSIIGKFPDDFELVAIAEVFEEVDSGAFQSAPMKMQTVVTARQVLDLQPKADNGQLSLVKEG